MSKIVKSAIRYNDKVYTGFDHGECFKQIDKDTIKDCDKLEQGFITDKNEFVDRQQALDIAYKAGQIPYEKNNHCLISEDVHLYWLNDLQSQLDHQKVMWNELKEHLNSQIVLYHKLCDRFKEENNDGCLFLSITKRQVLEEILYKMQELEKGEKDDNC